MIAWHIQNKYACQHGVPEQLHSDEGKNLNAQTVKDVCGYLHVWKTRTTPHRPQSDGQTERFQPMPEKVIWNTKPVSKYQL